MHHSAYTALTMAAAIVAAMPLPVLAQAGGAAPASGVSANPQDFVGTWRDDQGRFWFTIDTVSGNQVRVARFHLASLKAGRIAGDTLTLTSRSCVPLIGCYEYTHIAKLIAPKRLDMEGHSEACRFWSECRGKPDVVNFELTRE